MKLKDAIIVIACIWLSALSGSVIAQTDSLGKKYYAYAHLYSNDTYTEYISSVFCWYVKASENSQEYIDDTVTTWAKRVFKNELPDIKIRRCVCKFGTDSNHYFSANQATESWNMEISQSKSENRTMEVVSFPDCMKK